MVAGISEPAETWVFILLGHERLGTGMAELLVAGLLAELLVAGLRIGLRTGLRERHGTGPGMHQSTHLFEIGFYFFILNSHGLVGNLFNRRSTRLFPDDLDC
jgi:hypothetical protein